MQTENRICSWCRRTFTVPSDTDFVLADATHDLLIISGEAHVLAKGRALEALRRELA